ncbi:MAG: DUF4097 family beta strand repeat protein, partial [Lachnospiraceae bacterium]|nr:DUF4097 family beta strand repeat protein [Lachnospiraceae bacterium]
MKKGWMIVAAILVLVGLGVCLGGLSLLHFDFKKLDTRQMETNTYAVSEAFESISIHAETDKITFLPAEGKACRVECRESKKLTHEIGVESGALTVTTVDKQTWFSQIGFHVDSPAITVYLPEKDYRDLVIETDTGDIAIPEDFTFQTVQIKGDTSDVKCKASGSDRMDIALSTGDIDLSGIQTKALSLSVSTGKVSVDSATCKGDVAIHVSTGKVKLNGLTCGNLSTDGSTGNITLKDTVADGALRIQRSTGDVKFDGADAAEIYVQTSTGDVTGTLRTEKVF